MNVHDATPFELLARRACEDPRGAGYVFLTDGDDDADALTVTYGALHKRALAAAAGLAARVRPGDRMLLLHPPGPEFLVDLFACWALGGVAVPAALPLPGREGHAQTLARIVADCTPSALLTTDLIRDVMPALLAELSADGGPEIVVTGTAAAVTGDPVAPPSDGPCLLQYTSGSTGHPRGVVVGWDHLLANLAAAQEFTGQGPGSVAVSWLPHYHDMGLGGLIGALYGSYRCVSMSPLAFLKQPMRWPRAISRHRGTWTGAPNFAFDLCARRADARELAELDLSCLEIVANGAEPVRQASVERFIAAFAPAGLRPDALRPAYGLAEAVVFVSGVRARRSPRFVSFDPAGLRRRVAAPLPSGRPLAALGHPSSGHEAVIVDPESGRPCAPGEVGEIWLRGPSVAAGYWGRPELTRAVFGAMTTDGKGPYLRTGDLGFQFEGELYVSGRSKDLIIVRGANHYPQDIELTVEECHPAIRPGGTAAFALDYDTEQVVVVAEVRVPDEAPPGVEDAVRLAVAAQHGVSLQGVGLLPPRVAPRTSSGKIRRRACRALWETEPGAFLSRWWDSGAVRNGSGARGRFGTVRPARASEPAGPAGA